MFQITIEEHTKDIYSEIKNSGFEVAAIFLVYLSPKNLEVNWDGLDQVKFQN